MSISYDKLWKLMVDRKINKSKLHIITGLSTSTITKLKNNENVNVSVLERICRCLDCKFEDIIELEEDKK